MLSNLLPSYTVFNNNQWLVWTPTITLNANNICRELKGVVSYCWLIILLGIVRQVSLVLWVMCLFKYWIIRANSNVAHLWFQATFWYVYETNFSFAFVEKRCCSMLLQLLHETDIKQVLQLYKAFEESVKISFRNLKRDLITSCFYYKTPL